MCIQRTTYSCRHTHLQQLPCGNAKKSKQRSWFSFGSAKPVSCHCRYDWDLKQPCPKCRSVPLERMLLEDPSLEEIRTEREQRSRDYAKPTHPHRHYATPQPVGGIYAQPDEHPLRYATPQPVGGIYAQPDEPPLRYANPQPVGDIYSLPPPAQDAAAARPDSHYEPGLHAEVTNLPGHYEVSTPVQATEAPRPGSYYEPEVNARVANLPGHYDVSASPYITVPSQFQPAKLPPGLTSPQHHRSGMEPQPVPILSVRNRGSVTSPDRSHYMPGDGKVSPVSNGWMDPWLVGPPSGAEDVDIQSWQHSSGARYYSSRREVFFADAGEIGRAHV